MEENPFAKYVDKDNPFAKYKNQTKKQRAEQEFRSVLDQVNSYEPKDLFGGLTRGAGSIGATLLSPFETKAENQQRRQSMDDALTTLGADPSSMSYKTGKLMSEVAGTSGTGPLLAKTLTGIGLKVPSVIRGLQTAGLDVAGKTGLPGLAVRGATGAAVGGTAAGLVDPEYATTGLALGGALPVAAKVAGGLGQALRGPALPVTQQTRDTAAMGMAEGYILPPSQVKPTFFNRLLESVSGKAATQQIASTKNQAVTERLVRKALNFADDVPLSRETLQQYRAAQHAAGYEPVRQIGVIPASKGFIEKLDDIAAEVGKAKSNIPSVRRDDVIKLVEQNKLPAFDSGDAVDAIRAMRENADQAYRKGDNIIGRAYKGIADAYEVAIDDALQKSGNTQLLEAYRKARQQIAKSFTVEKALREGSGTLDARVIAKEFQKGKPLTDELLTVGKFANVFDKSSQPPHLIGSPDVHNLKTYGSMASGLGGFVTGGPVAAAIAASVPYVAPPAARSIMFSPAVQRGLLTPQTQINPQTVQGLLQMTQRTAPVLAAQ